MTVAIPRKERNALILYLPRKLKRILADALGQLRHCLIPHKTQMNKRAIDQACFVFLSIQA